MTNYRWCVQYGLELCYQFQKHRGKQHKTQDILETLLNKVPKIEDRGFTKFVLSMPDEYKQDCPVKSYRAYYDAKKRYDKNGKWMMKYLGREVPNWFSEKLKELVYAMAA